VSRTISIIDSIGFVEDSKSVVRRSEPAVGVVERYDDLLICREQRRQLDGERSRASGDGAGLGVHRAACLLAVVASASCW
jgi:hypothetical protein